MLFTRRYLYLGLIMAFALFYIFTNLTINNEVSTASGGVQEEFIMEYLMGKNFSLKGFINLRFLPDQSNDFIKGNQPLFYTHNPPLSSILHGLLVKIGLNLFQARIFYIFISLIGLAFLYLFIADIASIGAAVLVSILLIINFNGFLSFIDHNHYSISFPLLFIYLWAYNSKSPHKYFIISTIFFISSLISYMFLPFMIFLGLNFFIVDKDNKLFLYSTLGAISGIILHLIQNAITLTPIIAFQDLWLTVQNRIFGAPSRQELLNFYQTHNLSLWGGQKLLALQSLIGYLQSAITPFILFKTPIILAAISAVILYFKKQGNFYKNRKILIPVLLAFLIWRFTIELTIGVYPPIFHIILSIFLGVILSDLLSVLINDKKIAIKILVLGAMILISWKYFAWAGKITYDNNLSNLLTVSAKYPGKTFFTNIFMPNTISLKTGAWAVGGCLPDGLLNLDPASCYSKATTIKNEQLTPDYILLSNQSFAFDCSLQCYVDLKQKLDGKYELIENINNGEIIIYAPKPKI